MNSSKSPPAPATVLDERLTSTIPPLGCSFSIGALLSTLGFGMCYAAARSDEKGMWIAYAVGGGFAFFGMLVLFSWFRQILVRRTPRIIVEVSRQPWLLGQSARMALIQTGPARLHSLRANLLCFEQKVTWRKNASSSSTTSSRHVAEKILSKETLIEAAHLRVANGETWQEIREFSLAQEALPTKTVDNTSILWRLEVWGKGGFLGSFMHSHDVVVLTPEQAERYAKEEQEEEADLD